MIQNQEFDHHASIKRLAEAERKCSECGGKGFSHNLHREDGSPIPGNPCLPCGGTGYIAPFVALRVPCPYLSNRGQVPEWHTSCVCQGVLWIPEPDVRVACWRVFWVLPPHVRAGLSYGKYMEACTYEEAVLRAAEAWLEEKP